MSAKAYPTCHFPRHSPATDLSTPVPPMLHHSAPLFNDVRAKASNASALNVSGQLPFRSVDAPLPAFLTSIPAITPPMMQYGASNMQPNPPRLPLLHYGPPQPPVIFTNHASNGSNRAASLPLPHRNPSSTTGVPDPSISMEFEQLKLRLLEMQVSEQNASGIPSFDLIDKSNRPSDQAYPEVSERTPAALPLRQPTVPSFWQSILSIRSDLDAMDARMHGLELDVARLGNGKSSHDPTLTLRSSNDGLNSEIGSPVMDQVHVNDQPEEPSYRHNGSVKSGSLRPRTELLHGFSELDNRESGDHQRELSRETDSAHTVLRSSRHHDHASAICAAKAIRDHKIARLQVLLQASQRESSLYQSELARIWRSHQDIEADQAKALREIAAARRTISALLKSLDDRNVEHQQHRTFAESNIGSLKAEILQLQQLRSGTQAKLASAERQVNQVYGDQRRQEQDCACHHKHLKDETHELKPLDEHKIRVFTYKKADLDRRVRDRAMYEEFLKEPAREKCTRSIKIKNVAREDRRMNRICDRGAQGSVETGNSVYQTHLLLSEKRNSDMDLYRGDQRSLPAENAGLRVVEVPCLGEKGPISATLGQTSQCLPKEIGPSASPRPKPISSIHDGCTHRERGQRCSWSESPREGRRPDTLKLIGKLDLSHARSLPSLPVLLKQPATRVPWPPTLQASSFGTIRCPQALATEDNQTATQRPQPSSPHPRGGRGRVDLEEDSKKAKAQPQMRFTGRVWYSNNATAAHPGMDLGAPLRAASVTDVGEEERGGVEALGGKYAMT